MTKVGTARTVTRGSSSALWAAALALWALPAFASGPEPAGVGWDRLVFKAESGGTVVRAEVSLGPAGDLDAALLPVPDGLAAAGGPVRLLSAAIRQSGGLAGSSEWRGQVWFRPDGAVALQRLRHKLGDEPTVKIYRYAADGVQRRRARPKNGREAKRPPTEWRDARTKAFPYPPEGAGCAAVTDPFLLLYIASAAPPTDGAPLTLCVFNKKTLYKATLRARGTERLEPGHVETRPNGETVRHEQGVEALKILITTRLLGGAEPEPFEFFELRGDITLLLAPGSHLPLRIRGKARFVGQAEFVLTEARVTRSP